MNTTIKKPFCVGLTGGIGSGKTTVTNIFKALGVPIIDADVISHELTMPGEPAYNQIISHFKTNIINTDKTLNRKKLREIIFSQKDEKQWLESLLHPMIRAEMKSAIESVTTPYCICVIPLLAESKGITFLDRILTIEAPQTMQQQRAMERDNATRESIQNIIKTQASKAKRLAIANDVINNDSSLSSLNEKVLTLHQQYSHMSHQH